MAPITVNCVDVRSRLSPRLQNTFESPDLMPFIAGSRAKNAERKCHAGYAETNQWELLEKGILPQFKSAHPADLYALTQAWQLVKEKAAAIYTENRYALGVPSMTLVCYRNRGFLTSTGIQTKLQLKLKLIPEKQPEYPGNALADFHATLARTKIITICNLNELRKIDSNQITYDNLHKRQNQAPKLE